MPEEIACVFVFYLNEEGHAKRDAESLKMIFCARDNLSNDQFLDSFAIVIE